MLININTVNFISQILLRLSHNRQLEGLCLSRYLVLTNSFDSGDPGFGFGSEILGPDRL